ncbi:NADPH-dependent FMN reductase [Nocardia sp. alder85J]|uniref:NADPH-dependent FMN reductase n=1 Tax=Nocardia sp. alder85J TaxID=2862949 RepID=UPI001CD206D7|nr:NAD(P)H-dependent oxidoreductase [Nocardia sp. alder85J]MCX4093675.1 NAD(P)H-dependent oxidoreductase [Nocardia sp. alder85J]
MTTIGIIIGSTRPGRQGEGVARWVRELATAHAGNAAHFELVDLLDHRLPLLDEPVPAARAAGTHPHTRRWAERIGACDAFVFVTPEYNTSAPAALTNAIDYLLPEWAGKPVGYVGYGVYGAVMAIHTLRAQAGALRMADIGPQVALTLAEDFVNFAEFRPRELQTARLRELLDELLAWEQALGTLRVATQRTAS